MKTTLELPDELLIAAKKRAAEMRIPLRRLVERRLRRELIEEPLDLRVIELHTVGRRRDGVPADISTREKLRELIESPRAQARVG